MLLYYGTNLCNGFMPKWWNGRRDGLKIRCWRQRAGSSPAFGTNIQKAQAYCLSFFALSVCLAPLWWNTPFSSVALAYCVCSAEGNLTLSMYWQYSHLIQVFAVVGYIGSWGSAGNFVKVLCEVALRCET